MTTRRTFLTYSTAAGAVLAMPGYGLPTALAQSRALTVGLVSDPVTLDPHFMGSFFEISVQYNIFEPLLHLTPDLKVEAGLASVATPDPLTYVFTIRPNLTFHDGTPIDAEAVKANFDRMLDPAVGSPRRSDLGPVDTVTVTAPLVVTVRMKSPFAPFTQVLTNRGGMMVSPAAVKALGPDFATKAVGAGPYRVVSWTKNAELVLERFPGYWRGPAAIERVVFRPIPDETVRLTNLRSGTVQLVDAVPPQAVAQLRRETAVVVKQSAGLGFNAFSFNTTRAPFDDARVRKAFVAAVNPELVQRVVYFGTGDVAYGAIPPSIGWAHDPAFKPAGGTPEAAKKLLADAGKTAPVAVTITVTNSPVQVRTAELLQSQANQAGFKVEVRQIDPTSLITVLRQKDFDLCMSPWSGRSDPDGNMFNYFTKGGPNNFAGYDSAAVTDLLTKARGASATERTGLYRAAERQIAEDAPMLFLTFPATLQTSAATLDWVQYPDGAFKLQFAKFQ